MLIGSIKTFNSKQPKAGAGKFMNRRNFLTLAPVA